jgi:hypothetical protein
MSNEEDFGSALWIVLLALVIGAAVVGGYLKVRNETPGATIMRPMK